MDTNTVATTLAVVAALAAIIAALAAITQARAAGNSNRASFFINYADRYSSKEMAESLRMLSAWHHENKHDERRFQRWAESRRGHDREALALNQARRLVSRYYYDIASLCRLRLVTRGFAGELIRNNGLNLFYQVCDPLNRASQPEDRLDEACRILKGICEAYGNGEVYDKVATGREETTNSAQRTD